MHEPEHAHALAAHPRGPAHIQAHHLRPRRIHAHQLQAIHGAQQVKVRAPRRAGVDGARRDVHRHRRVAAAHPRRHRHVGPRARGRPRKRRAAGHRGAQVLGHDGIEAVVAVREVGVPGRRLRRLYTPAALRRPHPTADIHARQPLLQRRRRRQLRAHALQRAPEGGAQSALRAQCRRRRRRRVVRRKRAQQAVARPRRRRRRRRRTVVRLLGRDAGSPRRCQRSRRNQRRRARHSFRTRVDGEGSYAGMRTTFGARDRAAHPRAALDTQFPGVGITACKTFKSRAGCWKVFQDEQSSWARKSSRRRDNLGCTRPSGNYCAAGCGVKISTVEWDGCMVVG